MATNYVGYRHVLKGKNTNDEINPRTGEKGVYSNYSIYNPSQILDGGPDKTVYPGLETNRPYSKPTLLAYIFAGRHHIAPLKGAGNVTSTPYGLHTYHGLVGSRALGNAGHERGRVNSYSLYSNFKYDGLAAIEPMKNAGHLKRYWSHYGPFDPNINKGVTAQPLANAGHALTGDKIHQWAGVPSSKAL